MQTARIARSGLMAVVLGALIGIWGCSTPAPRVEQAPEAAWGTPFDHGLGMEMFLGLMPWQHNSGVFNNAPKDMPTLIGQFAASGGNLIQLQLMYQEGALFTKGQGLAIDQAKADYCRNIISACKAKGVAVTLVLFDNCSLKYPDKWAVSPLNTRNGGPFRNPQDIYTHFAQVHDYITFAVMNLHTENTCWEIINEGTSASFAGQCRDLLHDMGVTRVTTSGSNPGGLWKYSPHSATTVSCVKAGQWPCSDGATWAVGNVTPVYRAVRAIMGSGMVWDGATDAGKDWGAFLAAVRAR